MTPTYPAEPYILTGACRGDKLWAIYCAERIVAGFALLLLLPVFLVVALTICFLSRRGPLIRHVRAGRNGAPFAMLKFRTMWRSEDPPGALFSIETVSRDVPVTKAAVDARVSSRFAAFCRRSSLDEIPQLYHIMRGEMSFVGPRPITFAELEDHYGACASEVLSLRPGLTGLWQMMGRNQLSYARRKRLDLVFVRNASAGLYWHVLLRSIPRILTASGAF